MRTAKEFNAIAIDSSLVDIHSLGTGSSPADTAWALDGPGSPGQRQRRRVCIAFGVSAVPWASSRPSSSCVNSCVQNKAPAQFGGDKSACWNVALSAWSHGSALAPTHKCALVECCQVEAPILGRIVDSVSSKQSKQSTISSASALYFLAGPTEQ